MWMQSLFPDSPDSFRTEKDFKILREDSDENYMEGLMAEIPLKFLILRNLACSFILEIFFCGSSMLEDKKMREYTVHMT